MTFQVQVGIPNALNTNLASTQSLRVGGGALTATVVNSAAGVGQLVTTRGHRSECHRGDCRRVQDRSPTTVAGGGVAFDPLASGTTTVSATIPGFIATDAAAVEVAVSSPGITVNAPATVGSGLQQYGSFNLGASGHGGTTVTITSSDASLALVSPNASTAGSESIEVSVADGYTAGSYYVQGLAGQTGTVTLTASAPGFTDGSDTTAIVQPAIRIINLAASATTLSVDDDFQVQVGIPNALNTNLASTQSLRVGGGALTATVVNSAAGVGQLVTTPLTAQSVTVQIAEGQDRSPNTVAGGGVAFDPLASGTTTVSAAIPGFIATDAAAVEVAVSSPGITVNAPATVGSGLQQYGSFNLGASGHGGTTVTITSSDASLALVSPNASTAGSESIEVSVADGYTAGSYYVQGLAGQTGTVTLTASAPGFTDGSDTTAIVQPAIRIINLAASATTLSVDDDFQVQVGIPNALNTNLASTQSLRVGGGALTATVVNSATGVGQLVTTRSSPPRVSPCRLPKGRTGRRTPWLAAGVAFDPLASGTTTVSATIPGFIATDAATVEVTVTEE